MKADFTTISQESKVWIYQADRFFTAEEAAYIETKLNWFVENWQSHGQPVKAAGKLLHNLFIVLAADDSESPSGCSIDSSVHFLKDLEQELNINLFNRSTIALFSDNQINFVNLNKIKEAISSGKITKETLFFDNLVKNLSSFQKGWLAPFGSTWTVRYFG